MLVHRGKRKSSSLRLTPVVCRPRVMPKARPDRPPVPFLGSLQRSRVEALKHSANNRVPHSLRCTLIR
jgi:hypothetical protein